MGLMHLKARGRVIFRRFVLSSFRRGDQLVTLGCRIRDT